MEIKDITSCAGFYIFKNEYLYKYFLNYRSLILGFVLSNNFVTYLILETLDLGCLFEILNTNGMLFAVLFISADANSQKVNKIRKVIKVTKKPTSFPALSFWEGGTPHRPWGRYKWRGCAVKCRTKGAASARTDHTVGYTYAIDSSLK